MVSKRLELSGGATLGDCSPCGGCSGGLSNTFELCSSSTSSAQVGNSLDVNSPVTWVDLLAGTGIAAANVVILKIKNPTNFAIRFTTAEGADQTLRCSDLFVYSSQVAGQQITALAVRGVGSLERLITGN